MKPNWVKEGGEMDVNQILSTEEVVRDLKNKGFTHDQINVLLCSLDEAEKELDEILPDDMSVEEPFLMDNLMDEFGIQSEQAEWDELLAQDF